MAVNHHCLAAQRTRDVVRHVASDDHYSSSLGDHGSRFDGRDSNWRGRGKKLGAGARYTTRPGAECLASRRGACPRSSLDTSTQSGWTLESAAEHLYSARGVFDGDTWIDE